MKYTSTFHRVAFICVSFANAIVLCCLAWWLRDGIALADRELLVQYGPLLGFISGLVTMWSGLMAIFGKIYSSLQANYTVATIVGSLTQALIQVCVSSPTGVMVPLLLALLATIASITAINNR